MTGYDYIWVTPLNIYRFIEQHFEYGRVPFTGNGDNNPKLAYLVRLNKFNEYVSGLEKTQGWVETIKKKDILYFNNAIKLMNQ